MSRQSIRVRTCIATRTSHPDSELLRVVAQGESVFPDPARRMPGRGAWITPTLAAYNQAMKRHAFQRALRVSASVDTGPVQAYLENCEAQQVSGATEHPGSDNVRKTEH